MILHYYFQNLILLSFLSHIKFIHSVKITGKTFNNPVLHLKQDSASNTDNKSLTDKVKLYCDHKSDNQKQFTQCQQTETATGPPACLSIEWTYQSYGLDGKLNNVPIAYIESRPNSKPYIYPDYTDRFGISNDGNYNLVFHHEVTQKEYNGTYTCRVTIRTDDNTRDEKSVDVFILVPPSQPEITAKNPSFITFVDNFIRAKPVLNKDFELDCLSTEGAPNPYYTWHRLVDDKEEQIEPEEFAITGATSRRKRRQIEGENTDIMADQQASTGLSETSSTAGNFLADGQVRSQTSAESNKQFTKYLISNNQQTLIIYDIQRSDAGKYFCRAHNRATEQADGSSLGIKSKEIVLEPQAFDWIMLGSISIGVVILVLILLGVFLCCRRRARKNRPPPSAVMRNDNGRMQVTPTKSTMNTNVTGYTGGNVETYY